MTDPVTDPVMKFYPSSEAAPGAELNPTSSHGLMVAMVGFGKRVLEVGCANGFMARHLKARGNSVFGIDLDPVAVEEARAYCVGAVAADLDRQPLAEILPDERFDVIVFGDVLEHLRDPWRVLSDAKPFLAPGGYVVISIPNIAHGNVRLSLLRGAFDYSELGILDNTHLRFFTLRSVRELCLRAGFKIEAIDRTKVELFLETTTVPQVDEREFDARIVDAIRRDPEHDTLQFVIRATPVLDRDHLGVALDALAETETKLADSAAKIDRLERELEEYRGAHRRIDELTELLADRSSDLDHACERADALAARVRELEEGAADERVALVEEVAGLRTRAETNEVVITELRELADERAALVEETAALRAREEDREATLEALRSEAAELRTQLIETSRSVGEAYALRAAVDQAHASIASMREAFLERLGASDEELGRLRAASASSLLEAETLRRALEELRRDYEALLANGRETEAERDALAARLTDLEARSRAREAAAAETVAELRAALAKRELEVPPTTVHAPDRSELVERLDAELERMRTVHRATVDAFARHVDLDVSMLRAEMAEIDRLIHGIHGSRIWRLKGALSGARGLLRRGRARV